jgi:hypothetical protein
MNMKFDIQRHGRKWSRTEIKQKYHELCPEKIELIEGKMFWTDEQRLNMLGATPGKRRNGCCRQLGRSCSLEAGH